MKFKYTGRAQDGTMQTGFVQAPTREIALNILEQNRLTILGIDSVDRKNFLERSLTRFRKVKLKDQMIFARQFATLLEAKIPIGSSLRSLETQTVNPELRAIVRELYTDVEAGLSLSQAFERHSDVFSEFFINMVRSGEATGRIEEVMGYLAGYIEKEYGLLSRVRNALTYPAIVVVLFVIVAGILITVVFPQLGPIFAESNVPLPIFTRILLASGEFVRQWWWIIAVILGAFGVFVIDYVKTLEGREVFDQVKVQLPIFGNLFRKVYVARFSEAVAVLLRGGIPIAHSIEIAGHTMGNVVYREILRDVAEKVRGGELFSSALGERVYYFPPLVTQMLAIGESTGRMDDMLERIGSFYTKEVDSIVANLVELIQPALIAVIGVAVGILFASILIPIYNLAQAL